MQTCTASCTHRHAPAQTYTETSAEDLCTDFQELGKSSLQSKTGKIRSGESNSQTAEVPGLRGDGRKAELISAVSALPWFVLKLTQGE